MIGSFGLRSRSNHASLRENQIFSFIKMKFHRTHLAVLPSLLLVLVMGGCEKKRESTEASGNSPAGVEQRKARTPRSPDEMARRSEEEQSDGNAETALKFSEEDAAKGLEWAKAITDPEERVAALRDLAWNCAESHLDVAVAAVGEMPPGEDRNKLAAHLAANWATADSSASLEWAKGLADEDERDEALGGWVVAMGESSPIEAATLATHEMRPGAAQNRAVFAVLQRWARKDFNAAKEWVDKFPEGHLKQDALRELDAVKEKDSGDE